MYILVQQQLQICLDSMSKSKNCDEQLTHIVRVMHSYCLEISTLRFFALPSSVLLSAIGFDCPHPLDFKRLTSIPFEI